MRDPFEPRQDPARSIYLAFQEEAAKRPGRGEDERLKRECEAVLREATVQAKRFGWPAPSAQQVAESQKYARGSIDYGATWVYALLRALSTTGRGAEREPKLG